MEGKPSLETEKLWAEYADRKLSIYFKPWDKQ